MRPAGISMKNNVMLILLSLSLAVFGVITTEVAVIGLLPAATDGTVADHGTAGSGFWSVSMLWWSPLPGLPSR